MRKLTLDVESVSVESFSVLPPDEGGLVPFKPVSAYTCIASCDNGTCQTCMGQDCTFSCEWWSANGTCP